MITRRHLLASAAATTTALCAPWSAAALHAADSPLSPPIPPPASPSFRPFRLRYLLASALYGGLPLADILPEVAASGCESIDLWCKVHGTQREQVSEMGDEAFAALLAKYQVRLGASTRYPLGPFKLQDEMAWIRRHGGALLICGSRGVAKGQAEPSGAEAKAAIKQFLTELEPHVAKAAELGVTIAIENHANQILHHPDSLRAFAELNRSPNLGIAFAPHHLHAWVEQIPALIRDLGAAQLPHIYFQEHSPSTHQKMAKEIELQQLPGFGGGLDYQPIVQALRDVRFAGLAEIFMHPTPRGVPILPTIAEIRAVLVKARTYVEECVAKTTAKE